MNILVMGGSYFLGKHFVNMAKKRHSITVYNRGNMPFLDASISQIVGDRHDETARRQLAEKAFDVVVDFCAYQKGDIDSIISTLGPSLKQYIFISTVDVYERGLAAKLDETAAFEMRDFGGEEGAYILGKVSLEEELARCSDKAGIAYTSIRPAILYGPDNYAPREGIYFHWIKEAGQILHPIDATGAFQFAHVDDVAKAILAAIGNEEAYGQAYNLAGEAIESYESFAKALANVCDKAFEKVPVTVEQVLTQGIPLPFALTKEESNWYDGSKALALIGSYRSLEEGLREIAIANSLEKY